MKRAFNIATVVIITVTTVILGVFVFRTSYLRLWETMRDFGLSVAYYFSLIFKGESNITPTVNGFSNIFKASGYLPTTANEYKQQIAKFFMIFISKDNFNSWLANLRVGAEKVSKGIVLLMPCLIALWFMVKRIYSATNTKHGENTKPLKVVLLINDKVFLPVYRLIQGFITFIKSKKYVWITWLVMWLLNLNLVSIIVAFLSFYFYFAISFDVPAVFIQIAKLIIDLQVMMKTIPPWVFVIAGLFIWNKIRKSRALNKLKHFEARNCGFINELPIVSMSCGSMGKRKTTLITDMALSQEVMFRQEALKRLQIADMKFPYFPWILFEDEIKTCMEYRVIYNLATIKIWIEKKRKRYEKHKNSALQLYGYDTKKYPTVYKNGLYEEDIFDVLSTYARLYFIYVNLERKKRNLICRRTRLVRKVNLQNFNYFVTFTYDSKKHTEESFKDKLQNTLSHLCSRKKWKYAGVWERSPEKKRLHFHGLFYIPDETMPGELQEVNDFSLITHKRQVTVQNTYFNEKFGRSDFEKIDDNRKMGAAVAYILKYIEKSGERIVYSRGLPQYFISDILPEDVVMKVGQEEKKLLLFDDFKCIDEGCIVGTVSEEAIKQMPKSN